MDFGIIFDDIFDGFLKKIQKVLNLWKVLISQGKTRFFKVRRPHFFMFFRPMFEPFSGSKFISILSRFWEQFWLNFRLLFDPLGIILGYFFGIDFFMICWCHFGPLLAPNLLTQLQSGASLFSIFFLFFLGLAPGVDFWWILMDFGPICDGF